MEHILRSRAWRSSRDGIEAETPLRERQQVDAAKHRLHSIDFAAVRARSVDEAAELARTAEIVGLPDDIMDTLVSCDCVSCVQIVAAANGGTDDSLVVHAK